MEQKDPLVSKGCIVECRRDLLIIGTTTFYDTYNIVNKIFPIYTSKNKKKKCRDVEHKDPFVDEIA